MAIVPGILAIDEPEPAAVDKRADTNTMTRSALVVEREVVSIGSADDTLTENLAVVTNAAPAGGDMGLVVRNLPSGTQTVSGTVTADQGAAAAVAGFWPVGLVDAGGVNTHTVNAAGAGKVFATTADPVNVANGGTFATQDSEKLADNTAFADGTTPMQPAGYIFDEVAGTALTENDIAASRIDSKRAQVMVIEDATTRGTRAGVTANGLSVDVAASVGIDITDRAARDLGTVDIAAELPTGTNNIGDVDIRVGGALAPVGNGVAAGSLRVTVASDSTGVIAARGPVGHDGLSTDNPIRIAAKANNVEPAEVSAADDVVDLWADKTGRLVIVLNHPADVSVDSPAAAQHGPKRLLKTGTGDTVLVTAPGAGSSVFVTGISSQNRDSAINVCFFKDGTTIKYPIVGAADGGGAVVKFDPPWVLADNAALNVALDVAGTTGMDIGIHYFVAPTPGA